jgi:hypothetical protein
MFIPDPDFYPSRIQQQQQYRRGEKFVVSPFWMLPQISQNFKLFYFEQVP